NPCVSKFPLVKFNKSLFLSTGLHWIQGARVSDIRGVLLHFKFLDDFIENVKREAAREQYWNGASEYKGYLSILNRCPDLSFHSATSAKFKGSEQLVALGIMQTSGRLNR